MPEPRRLTLRLIPWPLLLFAAVFVLIAAYAWQEGSLHGRAWLLLAVPACVLLFFEVSTVTVDPQVREVVLRRTRPWGAAERRFSFDEVIAVAVESSTSGRSRTFGVVLALRSGERVPLRGFTSSGRSGKERLARRLADALNEGRSAPVQLATDGAVRESTEGSADGVPWTVDLVNHGGGWELTRFSTEAGWLDDGFVFVAPVPARGGPPPLAGMLGALVRGFLKPHLRGLELSDADLPGLDRAAAVDHALLSGVGLAASASDPDVARRWLDAGAAALLCQWQQAPLLHSGRGVDPYVVLGPGGLRLLFRASLRGDAETARIRDLGLALARARRA